MEKLCVSLSRQFNKEDNCKGRFWEGKFVLQPILDFQALINTMIYVDLNPIRAKMVSYPEQHNHSSICERFSKVKVQLKNRSSNNNEITPEIIDTLNQVDTLYDINTFEIREDQLNFNLYDYFKTLDSFTKVSWNKYNKSSREKYVGIFERLLN